MKEWINLEENIGSHLKLSKNFLFTVDVKRNPNKDQITKKWITLILKKVM